VKSPSSEPYPIERTPVGRTLNPGGTPLSIRIGVLGKKWSLLILRQVANDERASFSVLLQSHHRLSRRILSLRLKELQVEGYLEKIISHANSRRTSYILTEKGRDALPLLQAFSSLVKRYGEGVPVLKGRNVPVEDVCFAHPEIRSRDTSSLGTVPAGLDPFSHMPPKVAMYKDHCEKCRTGLAADSEAYVCSYECTWCRSCAEGFGWRCPNCQGRLQPRPRLPQFRPQSRDPRAPRQA